MSKILIIEDEEARKSWKTMVEKSGQPARNIQGQ